MPEYVRVRLRLHPGNHPKAGAGRYMPHVRVGPFGEYLGVAFLEGPEWILPGTEVEETLELMYIDGVDYSELQPGVHFDVLEGATIVADGVVSTRWTESGPWRSRPTA